MYDNIAIRLKALGHPARIRIMELLTRKGEAMVKDIYTELGLDQAMASQHLKRLLDAGVLDRNKRGVSCFYSIASQFARKVVSLVIEECKG